MGLNPHHINTIGELEALYGTPSENSVAKVMDRITPLYQQWIETSKFLILSTVGPEGTDSSPRGDKDAVVRIGDEKTVLLPDWHGNNRIDSLRNIVRDQRVSLLFLIAGNLNVVRINGEAVVTTDPAVVESFGINDKRPRSVVAVRIGEIYFQCAKALMRSALWDGPVKSADLPTAGDFIKEFKADFDGKTYDDTYSDYAEPRMW